MLPRASTALSLAPADTRAAAGRWCSQALLQSGRGGTENQYCKPLERCLVDVCSRSVLLALQANWWFQSNM
eukprot:COSAG06_NODE_16042_length_1026_cov_1.458468_1_plen_70_part_01